MSNRDNSLLLQDIVSASVKILEYTDGFSFDEFTVQFMVQDAVIQNFTVIGEAINRLPNDLKERHPQIEWKIIKDFRNRIVHNYFGIDLEIVWNIIKQYLPALKKDIETIYTDAYSTR